jgi:2-polyprenyl-3-methyl-5-hydroxy-6-metoxy-1,4-benzoquinol methylase
MTGDPTTVLSFSTFAECEMCGAPASEARVLGQRLSARQGVRPRRATGITTTIHRCRRCGLVFANPMPLPDDIADHYAVDPGEYWADATTAPDPGYFEEQIATFRRLWRGDHRDAAALDIGAGLGKAMLKLSRHGFAASGVEPSAPFREAAIAQNGIPGDRLLLGRIEDVEFDLASFDFITFGAVLEHLPAPSSAIERALAWLRPGGLIHIEVPSANWTTPVTSARCTSRFIFSSSRCTPSSAMPSDSDTSWQNIVITCATHLRRAGPAPCWRA